MLNKEGKIGPSERCTGESYASKTAFAATLLINMKKLVVTFAGIMVLSTCMEEEESLSQWLDREVHFLALVAACTRSSLQSWNLDASPAVWKHAHGSHKESIWGPCKEPMWATTVSEVEISRGLQQDFFHDFALRNPYSVLMFKQPLWKISTWT